MSFGTLTLGNTTALGSGVLTNNAAINVASAITTITANGLAGTNASASFSLSNLATTPLAVALSIVQGSDTTYLGTLIGLGSITKSGSAVLTLSGNNTYIGTTTLNGGTLQAGIASVAGTSGAFGLNSAVILADTAGVILDLNNNNTQIGSLATGGSTGGNVSLGSATLTIAGTAINTSYAGAISGDGGITISATGTQIFAGQNTYTGSTTVNSGTLTAGISTSGSSYGAFGIGSNIIINGGTLALGAFNETVGSVRIDTNGGSITSTTGILTATSYTLANTSPNTASISAILAGSGVTLTQSGTGTSTLSGANTYTGGTTITNGTLTAGRDASGSVGSISNSPFGTNTISIGSNGNLDTATYTVLNAINLNGGTITTSTGSTGIGPC